MLDNLKLETFASLKVEGETSHFKLKTRNSKLETRNFETCPP